MAGMISLSTQPSAQPVQQEHCLRRLNHPSIVKLHASFRDEEAHCLALELCPGGELWALVKDVGFSEPLARHYLAQVCEAVSYLRDARIVHRDLKAENVMISGAGSCKLVDFGTAKDLANPHIKGSGTQSFKKVLEHYVGTPNFMAPEVIHNKSSDFRSDTWSLGCMVYQVLLGLPPFYSMSEYKVYKRIDSMRLKMLGGISEVAQDLITRMMVKDPDARLGATDMKQIQEHPFFAMANFNGAHRRSAPVRTLEDCCLRHVGRRWEQLGTRVKSWMSEPECSVRQEALETLRRFDEVATTVEKKGQHAPSSETSNSDGSNEEAD